MSRYRSPAIRRYVIRLAVLMTLYMALLFGSIYLFQHNRPTGIAAYILAIAPALPIIGVFWAVMRLLVEEPDEFQRMLLVRQCLIATGFCLTIVTVWEFLQGFEVVAPGTGGFGAAFLWFVGLGVGGLYNRFTIGSSGGC